MLSLSKNHQLNFPALKQRLIQPFVLGLFASLLMHAWFVVSRAGGSAATENEVDLSRLAPVEITNYPMPKQSTRQAKKQLPPIEKQIVETQDAGNREEDPNAKYLSDRNQRAMQEMRAQSTDGFKEMLGNGKEGAADKGEAQAKSQEFSEDGLQPAKDWKDLSLKDLGLGMGNGQAAATDDHLRDVQTGDATVLSTKEFRFFSYYHRIKELLRQHWRPTVERKLAKIWNRGKNVSEEEMITRLTVLLDQAGSIQKISRVASSGFSELDDAAVEAFQKAGPFPNPPTAMVESDGFVRIQWDFVLRTEAAPRIQFRNAGGARN